MDIPLVAIFFSPLIAAVFAMAMFFFSKLTGSVRPKARYLLELSALLAIVGGIVSLILTIASMIWYEYSTGYSAGNGPLGWIFFYGPLSATFGQVVALCMWWFRIPGAWWSKRDSTLAA